MSTSVRAHRVRRVRLYALGVVFATLAACQSPAERQAARAAEINRQAAAEVSRICSLPQDQREIELKKVRGQSGVVLYCGDK